MLEKEQKYNYSTIILALCLIPTICAVAFADTFPKEKTLQQEVKNIDSQIQVFNQKYNELNDNGSIENIKKAFKKILEQYTQFANETYNMSLPQYMNIIQEVFNIQLKTIESVNGDTTTYTDGSTLIKTATEQTIDDVDLPFIIKVYSKNTKKYMAYYTRPNDGKPYQEIELKYNKDQIKRLIQDTLQELNLSDQSEYYTKYKQLLTDLYSNDFLNNLLDEKQLEVSNISVPGYLQYQDLYNYQQSYNIQNEYQVQIGQIIPIQTFVAAGYSQQSAFTKPLENLITNKDISFYTISWLDNTQQQVSVKQYLLINDFVYMLCDGSNKMSDLEQFEFYQQQLQTNYEQYEIDSTKNQYKYDSHENLLNLSNYNIKSYKFQDYVRLQDDNEVNYINPKVQPKVNGAYKVKQDESETWNIKSLSSITSDSNLFNSYFINIQDITPLHFHMLLQNIFVIPQSPHDYSEYRLKREGNTIVFQVQDPAIYTKSTKYHELQLEGNGITKNSKDGDITVQNTFSYQDILKTQQTIPLNFSNPSLSVCWYVIVGYYYDLIQETDQQKILNKIKQAIINNEIFKQNKDPNQIIEKSNQ